MSSSNETLRKRVETVLDMAVTTVSSLTESFTSGVPVLLGDEVAMVKEKYKEGEVPMEITENSKVGGLIKMSNGNAEETDGDEDEEVGVLEVHG